MINENELMNYQEHQTLLRLAERRRTYDSFQIAARPLWEIKMRIMPASLVLDKQTGELHPHYTKEGMNLLAKIDEAIDYLLSVYFPDDELVFKERKNFH